MKTVQVYSSFQDVPTGVRDRLSYPNQPNFLLSFEWFSLLFETSLRETLTPRIYVVLDDEGRANGALFCGVERGGVARRLLSLTNFYTIEYSHAVVPDTITPSSILELIVDY